MVRTRLHRCFLEGIARITRIGADPVDDNEVALQKILLVGVSLACVTAGLVWGLVYFAAGVPLAGAIPWAYSVLSLASTAFFARKRDYRRYQLTQLTLILLLPWLMMIALGGFQNSSAVTVWSILCPIGALLLNNVREAVRWFLAFLVLLASGFPLHFVTVSTGLSPVFIAFFYVMNIGGVLSIAFLMLLYFVRQKNLFQEKSESLLLNILPKEIAEVLKAGPRSIAEHFDEASILFADVVDFTALSDTMEASQLVNLLDEVFLCFDQLADQYGLEKIKTIGDCYMVAAGVPQPRRDHAQILARMALDMQCSVSGRQFRSRRLTFRIGMNSGPVVAGVIGRKKFIYDLWGDAVNMASRMEAYGKSGAIQITRATYELIKDDFICEPGGIIPVKGKCETEVWLLRGERTGGRGAPGQVSVA